MELNLLNQEEIATLRNLLSNATNIVICAHKSPDGDATGSSLAWMHFLNQIGKTNVKVCMPDATPDFLHWLPGHNSVIRYDRRPKEVEKAFKEADLVCCLDFNQNSRVDAMQEVLESSTAPRTYNSSRPEIFYIIGQLLAKNIDKDEIYNRVFHNYSTNALRLRAHIILNKMKVIEELHASYYTVTKEEMAQFHFIKGDMEGLVNIPQQIKGLKLSISLREDTEKPKTVLVSLRSCNGFHCQPMAAKFFNGGGHADASGGRLNCTIEEAEQIAIKAILYYKEELQ